MFKEQQQQEIRTAVYNISEGIFNVMTTLVEKYIHYGDMSRMFKVYEEDEYQSEIIKELDRMKNEIVIKIVFSNNFCFFFFFFVLTWKIISLVTA